MARKRQSWGEPWQFGSRAPFVASTSACLAWSSLSARNTLSFSLLKGNQVAITRGGKAKGADQWGLASSFLEAPGHFQVWARHRVDLRCLNLAIEQRLHSLSFITEVSVLIRVLLEQERSVHQAFSSKAPRASAAGLSSMIGAPAQPRGHETKVV